MPVISFKYEDFMNLLGLMVPRDELIDRIPMMGADVASTDYEDWDIEFFPDRPDLYSVEGAARAYRNFLCDDDNIKEYDYAVEDSGIVCKVDPGLKDIRPFIGCAKVTGVHFSDELITSLMNLQEKLHLTLGRKRVKVAIGVYDISPLVPPIFYKATDPKEVVFIPLEEMDGMNLTQILRRHKKGREYAFVLEGFDKYPILMDSNETVLSFPPIINSEVTRVKEYTTDLFVDVTGTSEDAVNYVLNIMCTALAERHAHVHSVTIEYPDRTVVTPDLSYRPWDLSVSQCNKWLGIELSPEQTVLALRHMGYKAKVKDPTTVDVGVPPYRADILHQVDLWEDVGIGYGYDRIPAVLPKSMTYGTLRREQRFNDRLRRVFLGLGFFEVNTLTLSSEEAQFTNMGHEVPGQEAYVKITNPISKEHTMLRKYLMPSLFNILRANKHRELPQRIFEVGIVIPGEDAKNRFKASALVIDSKAAFTDAKSFMEALMRELYVSYEITARDVPPYIRGRSAVVAVNGVEVGDFGEVAPATIHAFELGNPVLGLNLDVERLIPLISGEEPGTKEGE